MYQEFARGYFAMYITGPWNLGEFRRRLPPETAGRVGDGALPGPDAAHPGVSLAGGSSLVLFASSPHPEAAWKFIEFLSAPGQQLRFYALTGDLPARSQAWEDSSLAARPEHPRLPATAPPRRGDAEDPRVGADRDPRAGAVRDGGRAAPSRPTRRSRSSTRTSSASSRSGAGCSPGPAQRGAVAP